MTWSDFVLRFSWHHSTQIQTLWGRGRGYLNHIQNIALFCSPFSLQLAIRAHKMDRHARVKGQDPYVLPQNSFHQKRPFIKICGGDMKGEWGFESGMLSLLTGMVRGGWGLSCVHHTLLKAGVPLTIPQNFLLSINTITDFPNSKLKLT